MLEKDPAWQDEQTASDDRFAPAPPTRKLGPQHTCIRNPRTSVREITSDLKAYALVCVCCFAIPAVLYIPGEQGDPTHDEVPAEWCRKGRGQSSENFS